MKTFTVTKKSTQAVLGTVQAQTAEEAIKKATGSHLLLGRFEAVEVK